MVHSMSLRVLLVGDSPNLFLYTSRFNLAKGIDLYHVSTSDSSSFQIETIGNNAVHVELSHHYQTIAQLSESFAYSGSAIFDLLLISSSSLQEMSSLVGSMASIIDKNTKILVESSGFVQLEPFVKASLGIPQMYVFSIVSDYDIRQVKPNQFKQFPTKAQKAPGNNIYLGSNLLDSSSYPAEVLQVLETFQKLFQKLLPYDRVDLCKGSRSQYLSKQWEIALPRVALDPLLVMLDEINVVALQNQILAKPLISGLLTELFSVIKSMHVSLPNTMSEASVLEEWQECYRDNGSMPAFVYHFVNRTASLNLDMLLLQPILLADDNGIRTPYLEFLYSVMSQYDRFNRGESSLFARRDVINDNTSEKQYTEKKLKELGHELQEKENIIASLKKENGMVKTNLQNLNNEVVSLKRQLAAQAKKYESSLEDLARSNNNSQLSFTAKNNSQLLEQRKSKPKSELRYNTSGTHLLDEQSRNNTAFYSTNHSGSAENTDSSLHGDRSPDNVYGSSSGSSQSLKEKELQLRKKELDLQERELELQRRAMQQQQYSRGFQNGSNVSIPPVVNPGSRQSSMSQIPSSMYFTSRSSRSINGPAASTTNSSLDLGASNMPYKNAYQTSLQGPMQIHSNYTSGIKPTSRKNRVSNIPNIGGPSSMNPYVPTINNSQSRLNSMSAYNASSGSNRFSQQPTGGPYPSMSNVHRINSARPGTYSGSTGQLNNTALQKPVSSQQRQFSSSSEMSHSISQPNISTSTVIQNSMSTAINSSVRTPIPLDSRTPSAQIGTQATNIPQQDVSNDNVSAKSKEKKKKFRFFGKKK